MPHIPATRWIPDSDVQNCTSCGVQFNLFTRRHHCRNCRTIFCGQCSSYRIQLRGYGEQEPVRVCRSCYDELEVDSSEYPQRKVTLLGPSGVGKTALASMFLRNHFPTQHQPTIDATSVKLTRYRNTRHVWITLVDAAAQDQFSSFQPVYAIGTHCFLLVFSLTDASSLSAITQLCSVVASYVTSQTPMILVGTKADAVELREVTREMAEATAAQLGIPYIETAATDLASVEALFACVLEKVLAAPEDGDRYGTGSGSGGLVGAAFYEGRHNSPASTSSTQSDSRAQDRCCVM